MSSSAEVLLWDGQKNAQHAQDLLAIEESIFELQQNAHNMREMADYIEGSLQDDPSVARLLTATGREYIVQSTSTAVAFSKHLIDGLDSALKGQEISLQSLALSAASSAHRAAAAKQHLGLALVQDWQSNRQFSELKADRPARARRDRIGTVPEEVLHTWSRPLVKGDAQTPSHHLPCFDLAALDSTGHSLASEQELQEDAEYMRQRPRRPTVRAADKLPDHLKSAPSFKHTVSQYRDTLWCDWVTTFY